MTRRSLPALLTLLVLLPGLAPTPCEANSVDDYQAWLGMNTILWKQPQGKWNLSFWTEARFRNDISEPLGYFIGPGTRYRAHQNLDLNFAIRFILFKTDTQDLELVRYQFAITPHFRLFKNSQLRIRNRAEWITSRGDLLRTRIRHRFQIGWKIHDKGPLIGAYVSEEFFYTWGDWKIGQNRFVPLGLVWKTGDHIRLSTYYMLQYISSVSANIHSLGVTAIWTLDP